MIFHRATLDNCATAGGLVVAIDVLRAFTTAAYCFDAGVREILLVAGVQEAFDLRRETPGALILGEIDGVQVEGFDLGNSPSSLAGVDLWGKQIIQRTTAGTQGVVRARRAEVILAASLVNASATARAIQGCSPAEVTFIQTGFFRNLVAHPVAGHWGDEDVACADLIEARLSGSPVDLDAIAARVRRSRSGRHYDGTRPAFPPADLELALHIDRFPFAMRVERDGRLHRMRPVFW